MINSDNIKKFILFVLVSFVFTLSVLIALPRTVDSIHMFDSPIRLGETVDDSTVLIDSQQEIIQSFLMPFDYFTGIDLIFYTDNVFSDELVTIVIEDSKGGRIAEWKTVYGMVENGLVHKFRLKKTDVIRGEEYSIIIRSPESVNVKLKASTDNTYDGGELLVADKAYGDLDATIYGRNETTQNVFYFGLILFVLVISVLLLIFNICTWRVLAVLLLVLYAFSFSQAFDLNLTIIHAKELLYCMHHGELRSFYDIAWQKALTGDYLNTATPTNGAFYNITLYFCLAVIIAPIRFLEMVGAFSATDLFYLLWVKLVISCLVAFSAKYVGQISKLCIEDDNVSDTIEIFYLTSVITLFSSIGFGQLDIIPVMLILVGFMSYLKGNTLKFVLFFSLAIVMKSFAILIFIPLVLLRYKQIIKVLYMLMGGISLTALNALLYMSDLGYIITRKTLGENYDFMGRLFASSIKGGIQVISLFVLVYILVCISAYRCNLDSYLNSLKYVLLSLLPFYLFVLWHPQWLMIIIPFMCLGLPFVWHEAAAVQSFILVGLFYWLDVNLHYPFMVDNYMVNKGILPLLTKHTYSGATMSQMVAGIRYSNIFVHTGFCALLFAYIAMYVQETKKAATQKVKGNVSVGIIIENALISIFVILTYLILFFYV